MEFDPSSLLGPSGGLIAISYAAGATSGYAFCLRTLYKILKVQSEKDEKRSDVDVAALQKAILDKDAEIKVLNDRLLFGLDRQRIATSDAGLALLKRRKDIE